MLIEAIDRCDAVVAILDGPDSDSGTCVEIGYARALGKPIIGIRTDFRDGEVHGINVMSAAPVRHSSSCIRPRARWRKWPRRSWRS